MQQVAQARKTVHGYSKLLSDHAGHLVNTRDTIQLVNKEKQLQTASVTEQVQKIHSISQELLNFLQKLGSWAKGHAFKQYLRVMVSGQTQEKELVDILDRLDRARSELVVRILLIQTGAIDDLSDGLAATRPIMKRMESNILQIVSSVSQRERDTTDQSTHQDTADRESCLYVGNTAFDQAQMINGNIGLSIRKEQQTREYRNNEARGRSLQVNGGIDFQSFEALLVMSK